MEFCMHVSELLSFIVSSLQTRKHERSHNAVFNLHCLVTSLITYWSTKSMKLCWWSMLREHTIQRNSYIFIQENTFSIIYSLKMCFVIYSKINVMFWNSPSCLRHIEHSFTNGFLSTGQWCNALAFSLMFAWTSCWTSSRVSSDLTRP